MAATLSGKHQDNVEESEEWPLAAADKQRPEQG
jgi:hypothetical protein